MTRKIANPAASVVGTTVTVTGEGVRFRAEAAAFISGANLLARNGGVIALPGTSDYQHASTGNNQHRTLRAAGADSRLELPNLELIAGGTGRYGNDRGGTVHAFHFGPSRNFGYRSQFSSPVGCRGHGIFLIGLPWVHRRSLRRRD